MTQDYKSEYTEDRAELANPQVIPQPVHQSQLLSGQPLNFISHNQT